MKLIQDPNSDASANQPPAGSILYNYNEFATGSKKVEYPRDEDSLQISIEEVSINPFGLGHGDSSKVLTGISQRVLNNTNLTPVLAAGGVSTTPDPTAVRLTGFEPAKAVVFIADATQPTTPEPSQITGIKYKKRAGSSFTVPYGSKAGETNERAVRASIAEAVAGITRGSVSFKSEKL